ncbi:valine--tRNA ligase [Candidatus Saccharibacteria bacterium]|nr:valine--tRNA ligase [Candidatus Saccharibacteria bacterium]
MKFTSSYEPDKFESDIYAAWEKSGFFNPISAGANGPLAGHHGGYDRVIAAEPRNDGSEDGGPAGGPSRKASTYSIVMPPPNANGNLHIGHGLTIAIEDSLTRYYRLKGCSTWYIPGADHAGFETWVVYERALEAVGHSRFEYTRDELYAKVWDFVEEQRGNMELQVRALGASCAWDDLTFTLDENVVARVYQTFEKMWNDGMIYRGEKLVNYCPKHQTAFADIEVEHIDEPGHLWDIKYPLEKGEKFIVVSTTRPETLFGDMAVAVNPEDKRYKDLIGKRVKLPLTDRTIPIIADEHADPEYGTGAVKITPAHDFDDFEVGKRHELEMLRVIGDDGKMLETAGEKYAGLTTEECRKMVLKDLESEELLLGSHEIVHSVAHCYKCGTIIEPTLKEQWFVDTEKLAATAIEHLENDEIKFYPSNKKQVLINYLKGLKDWNISRQIPWGIPIPMFKKTELASGATGKTNYDDAPDWVFDSRTNLTEIELGGVKYLRDEDTFDTWFSSSHWPIVTTDWTEQHGSPFYPLNVMETGADILFAWVARMIMMGLYVTGEVPFKEVYLHGLVLDAHGKKMSKSKGNVINPLDLVMKYGSDAFRLGILRGRSAGLPQAFSEESVVASRNLCNKLWNIARLIDSWVDEAPVDGYDTDNMGEDWICREINSLKETVEKCMKEYRFAEAVEAVYSTIWDKYADWFLESQKQLKNLPLLKKTLEDILIIAHPFMPFVTETIWQSLSWTKGFIISQNWPHELDFDPITAEEFERLMLTVLEARKVLAGLKDTVKGISVGLLYGDDGLVEDNAELVRHLTRLDYVKSTSGTPRGIRLALSGREVYLDVPSEIVKTYHDQLESRILSVGRELDALNARMFNPRYVEKAPAHLVEETRKGIEEKKALIERLKLELSAIE